MEYWPTYLQDDMLASDISLLNNVLDLYDWRTGFLLLWFKHSGRASSYSGKPSQMTSQHAAAFNGHRDILEYLYRREPFEVDARDDNSRTALFWASEQGHLGAVRWLLDRGASINARDCWNDTALIVASFEGQEDIVRLLLDRDADVHARNQWNATALIDATYRRYMPIMLLLLEAGADVNQKGIADFSTALMTACDADDSQIARILLDRGADIDSRNEEGQTAL